VALRSPAALDPAEADSVVGGQASCTGINTKTESGFNGCDKTKGCGNVANIIQDGTASGEQNITSGPCVNGRGTNCGSRSIGIPKCS